MTRRAVEFPEFRWKITSSRTGQCAYGSGWSRLYSFILDCYRRGVCFRVELKELSRSIPDYTAEGWHDSSDDSGDVTVRLSHVEFDEKRPECNPGCSD